MTTDTAEPNQPVSGGSATPMQGNAGPVSEPNDIPPTQTNLDDSHPATDTSVQTEEQYEEGLAGAVEVSDDSTDNAIPGFKPEQ